MALKVFELQISFLLEKSVDNMRLRLGIGSYGVLLRARSSLRCDDHILTLIFVSTQNTDQRKLHKASPVSARQQ